MAKQTKKLARQPSIYTRNKPVMQSFKMGLQGSDRTTKSLCTKHDQVVEINNKAVTLTVYSVKTHESGELTGIIRVNGETREVKEIKGLRIKVRKTIHGLVLQPIRTESAWQLV